MIHLEEITKEYRYDGGSVKALQGLSLQIHAGEFVAIEGASGSGKTTLLSIVGCLDSADQGVYLFHGKPVARAESKAGSRFRNQSIGYVMQDFALIDNEDLLFNCTLPAYFGQMTLSQARVRAKALLKELGLGGLEKKKANQLSGGQKQRVAIVRALLMDAPVLLADEPTGSLDSETSKQIMQIFTRLNQTGKTILMVTHSKEIAAYATRSVQLKDGQVLSDSREMNENLACDIRAIVLKS